MYKDDLYKIGFNPKKKTVVFSTEINKFINLNTP